MKIKIIEVDHKLITLADCGFRIGDVVEVSGRHKSGNLSVQAIRDTEFVSIGSEIIVQEDEYEVIEE